MPKGGNQNPYNRRTNSTMAKRKKKDKRTNNDL